MSDTDLFLTKIGLEDYNFIDELIKNDDDDDDDDRDGHREKADISEDENNKVDDEAEKKLNQLNQHSKQMQAGI